VTYAALDERIKAASFHAYGGTLGKASGIIGTKKLQPHYGHIIPGSSRFLHDEDMIWLVAPRALQGVRGDRNDFPDPDFVSTIPHYCVIANQDTLSHSATTGACEAV
jgi:hypothetical protein